MGTDHNIGCIFNDNEMSPLTNAKNALVMPQVGQGTLNNLCTIHPGSIFHITKTTKIIDNRTKIL